MWDGGSAMLRRHGRPPGPVAGIDPGLLAVLIVAGIFIVWYFAGSVFNKRLARRIANEMRDSLVALGVRTPASA